MINNYNDSTIKNRYWRISNELHFIDVKVHWVLMISEVGNLTRSDERPLTTHSVSYFLNYFEKLPHTSEDKCFLLFISFLRLENFNHMLFYSIT